MCNYASVQKLKFLACIAMPWDEGTSSKPPDRGKITFVPFGSNLMRGLRALNSFVENTLNVEFIIFKERKRDLAENKIEC